jgi:hypothetical protein
MAYLTISNRDKKMIIWNFMEELWENYQNSVENNLTIEFEINNFYNFGILLDYLKNNSLGDFDESEIYKILVDYANEKHYITTNGKYVALTQRGLDECAKSIHDWD